MGSAPAGFAAAAVLSGTVVAVAALGVGPGFLAGGVIACLCWGWKYFRTNRPSVSVMPANNEILWMDCESALRTLDRLGQLDGSVGTAAVELGRIGRRAVADARRAPADPGAVRLREILPAVESVIHAWESGGRGEPEEIAEQLHAATTTLRAESRTVDERDQRELQVHQRVLRRLVGKGERES